MSSVRIHPDPVTSPIPSSPSSASRGPRLAVAGGLFRRQDNCPAEWHRAQGLIGYDDAVATMERLVERIASGAAPEQVWLVEHPPLLTVGTGAASLPTRPRFPVHKTGRGGQVTYHGPGQRVAYVMLDLKARRFDVRAFVAALEQWIIDALLAFGIRGERREDRVGVWVRRHDEVAGADGASGEDKIAAIGIRVRRWVSFHGIALNVAPDLSHYDGFAPCGISGSHYGITSLAALGHTTTMGEVDDALRAAFEPIFGAARGT